MPPSSRPTAPPPVAIAAQTPIAFVRSRPSAKVVVRSRAPPARRARRRGPGGRAPGSALDGSASPFRSEATVKTTTPARKTPLPADQVAGAAAEEQEAAEDQRVGVDDPLQVGLGDIFSSVWIDGSATFTIVASRMTMNCARQTRQRTSQGFVLRWASSACIKRGLGYGCVVVSAQRKARRNWIQEERRKTLGDYTCFCLGCGSVWRYFLERRGRASGRVPALRRRDAAPLPRVRRAVPVGVRGRVRGVRRRGTPARGARRAHPQARSLTSLRDVSGVAPLHPARALHD